MATNTPFYPGDTRWTYFKRWVWLMWDEYWSPFGPKHCGQYMLELTANAPTAVAPGFAGGGPAAVATSAVADIGETVESDAALDAKIADLLKA